MELEILKGTVVVTNTIDEIKDKIDKFESTTDAKLKEAISKVETRIDDEMLEVEKAFVEFMRYTRDSIDYAIDAYDSQLQPTQIVVGAHPKKRSKYKFIQWLLIKIFGYELEYKTVMAKTVVIRPEDYPFYDEDIEITF